MHVILVVAVMLVVLLAGRLIERRMFGADAVRKEAFRRRMNAWSWRAAGVAFVVGIVFAIWLRHMAPH